VKKNSTLQGVNKNEEDVIVKENANRYTWEGRFLDYSFLKKVDKKVTDKRFGMSFSDFKRMKQTG
jgi:hypothetical protein